MNTSQFVPQVSYDIIGRLIPGLIVLFGAILVHTGLGETARWVSALVGKKEEIAQFSITFILLILTLSYVIASGLIGLWAVVLKITKRHNLVFLEAPDSDWKNVNIRLTDDLRKAGTKCESVKLPSVSFVYDSVRLWAPDVGARLVKVRAECQMCAVLLVGFALLFIWNLIELLIGKSAEQMITAGILLSGCLAFWLLRKELESRFRNCLANYWFLLSKEGRRLEHPNQPEGKTNQGG